MHSELSLCQGVSQFVNLWFVELHAQLKNNTIESNLITMKKKRVTDIVNVNSEQN